MTLLIIAGCSSVEEKEISEQPSLGPYEKLEEREPSEKEPLVVGVDDYNDPLESVNRAVFYFNDKLYRYVLTPVADGYLAIVPKPVNKCVTNAFKNLREPLYTANFLLQGKPKKAGKSFLRMCINTTIGLFGLFDPASAWFGLDREKTTFGQTLASYGVSPGPYFVIPVLGPSTVRDTGTLAFEYHVHPIKHIVDKPESTNILIFEAFHELAPTMSEYDDVTQDAEDRYTFIRNLYLQGKIRDDKYEVNDSEKDSDIKVNKPEKDNDDD